MGWSLITLRPAGQLWPLLPSLAPDSDPGPSGPLPGTSVKGRAAGLEGAGGNDHPGEQRVSGLAREGPRPAAGGCPEQGWGPSPDRAAASAEASATSWDVPTSGTGRGPVAPLTASLLWPGMCPPGSRLEAQTSAPPVWLYLETQPLKEVIKTTEVHRGGS